MENREKGVFPKQASICNLSAEGLCWGLVGLGWMECHLGEFVGGSLPGKGPVRLGHCRVFSACPNVLRISQGSFGFEDREVG